MRLRTSLLSPLALILSGISAFGQSNSKLAHQYGKLPLSFEMNQGQTNSKVNFLSRGSGYALFLTPNEAVFSLSKPQSKPKNGKKCYPVASSVLRMKLLGANPNPKAVGEAKLPGVVNYFKGNDPKQWRKNIGTYGKVRYQSVYKGIDQVFYGNQRKLEYDFVVSPFADYKQVKMEFAGAKSVKLLKNGDLKLNLKGGSVTWQAPLVYQEANGKRTQVAGKYVLQGKRRVGFEVARYDRSKPLVIDPVLTYSTFVGGTGDDFGNAVAVDSFGQAYVTGGTASSDFPTNFEAFDFELSGSNDVFITKVSADGTSLLYSTYLGGTGNEEGRGIALDSSGNAYITGYTASTAFPTTTGAFDESHNGIYDAFVAKFALGNTPYLFVGNANAQYGVTSVTLKAKMTNAFDGSALSGKTLSASVDGGTATDYTTDTNGEISFTYDPSAKNVGDNIVVTVSFAGDATYDPQTATSKVLLQKAKTTLTIDPAIVKANYRLGQAMSPQIKATLTRTHDGAVLSGVALDFTLDGTSIGSAATDMSGVATLAHTPPTSLGAGKKALIVTFAATTNYYARSRTVNLTFSKTPTAIVLPVVSGNRNTSVNLVATLANKDTSAALEGKTVKFFVAGSLVGSATTNASGVATLSYLLGGTAQKQTLQATFDGDDTFAASTRSNNITTK